MQIAGGLQQRSATAVQAAGRTKQLDRSAVQVTQLRLSRIVAFMALECGSSRIVQGGQAWLRQLSGHSRDSCGMAHGSLESASALDVLTSGCGRLPRCNARALTGWV